VHLKIRLTHNVVPSVTKVEKIILDNIKATGPLSFSTYMQLCLSHPTHGYYMNSSNKVFGSGGDFITSPEISQVFAYRYLAAFTLGENGENSSFQTC